MLTLLVRGQPIRLYKALSIKYNKVKQNKINKYRPRARKKYSKTVSYCVAVEELWVILCNLSLEAFLSLYTFKKPCWTVVVQAFDPSAREVEARLVYGVNSRTAKAKATQRTLVSKPQTNKQKNQPTKQTNKQAFTRNEV